MQDTNDDVGNHLEFRHLNEYEPNLKSTRSLLGESIFNVLKIVPWLQNKFILLLCMGSNPTSRLIKFRLI